MKHDRRVATRAASGADSNQAGDSGCTSRVALYATNVRDHSYDEVVPILDETAADPTTAVEHRFLNGEQLDQVFTDHTPDGILRYLHDLQNSVTDVVKWDNDANADPDLINHLEYDSFGNVVYRSSSDSTELPQQTYTGLIYYDARWFDPAINPFISEDPIGFVAGDTNLRRYVGNSNPNAVDPIGMMDSTAETLLAAQGFWGSAQRSLWNSHRKRYAQEWASWLRRFESRSDQCESQQILQEMTRLESQIAQYTYLINSDRSADHVYWQRMRSQAEYEARRRRQIPRPQRSAKPSSMGACLRLRGHSRQVPIRWEMLFTRRMRSAQCRTIHTNRPPHHNLQNVVIHCGVQTE